MKQLSTPYIYTILSLLFLVATAPTALLLVSEPLGLAILLPSLPVCSIVMSIQALRHLIYRSLQGNPHSNDSNNPGVHDALEQSTPTKEQLNKLKTTLDIRKGSLQYKKRGDGVYLVIYESGRHCWTHLGSWVELKKGLRLKEAE